MKTVVDNQGCHTKPGDVGLEVSGMFAVNGVHVLKVIADLEERVAALTARLELITPEPSKVEAKPVNNLFKKKQKDPENVQPQQDTDPRNSSEAS